MLVYGGHAVRSGLIDRVKQSLTAAGVGLTELFVAQELIKTVKLKCCGI